MEDQYELFSYLLEFINDMFWVDILFNFFTATENVTGKIEHNLKTL